MAHITIHVYIVLLHPSQLLKVKEGIQSHLQIPIIFFHQVVPNRQPSLIQPPSP